MVILIFKEKRFYRKNDSRHWWFDKRYKRCYGLGVCRFKSANDPKRAEEQALRCLVTLLHNSEWKKKCVLSEKVTSAHEILELKSTR